MKKEKIILHGEFEIVDVENPTSFISGGVHYRFDALSKKQCNELIMSGFPHLKKVDKKATDSGSTEGTK